MTKRYFRLATLASLLAFSVCVNAQGGGAVTPPDYGLIDYGTPPELIADSIVIFVPDSDMPSTTGATELIVHGTVVKVEKGAYPNVIVHNANMMTMPLQAGVPMRFFLKRFADRDAYYFVGIFPLVSGTVFSADYPVYINGTLTLPRIDAPDQAGKYQDLTFQLTPQGSWALSDVQVLGTGKVYPVGGINGVEVVKAGTLPVSVYLRASGVSPSCDYTGPARIHQRLVGTRFDVTISAPHLQQFTVVSTCTANIRSFKMTVPLQVYGLSAGTYSYNVNGITGTFSLDSDNKFPGDCDVTAGGMCP